VGVNEPLLPVNAFFQALPLQPPSLPLQSEATTLNDTLLSVSQQGSTLTPSAYKEQPVLQQPIFTPFPWQALIPSLITKSIIPPATVPPQPIATDTMFPQRPLAPVPVPIGFYAIPVV
jgi:hypothetical protein